MDGADGGMGSGPLILLAEKYKAQGHKLHIVNTQTPEIIIATDGWGISVERVYRSPGSTSVKNEELSQCECSVYQQNSHTGDFNAPEIDWVTETVLEVTFGHQLLHSVRESGAFQHVIQATRRRFGHASSTHDLVLTRTPNVIWSLKFKDPMG